MSCCRDEKLGGRCGTSGFHTGFFEKGGKSSDAPHLPGNSAYYQCFDSWNTPLEKILGVFEQLNTFLLQQMSLGCCLCFKATLLIIILVLI